ncbi:MAG: selenide, water dikinase SelD [Helicobacteraceae bacterium]|jgi:selenide,water dikinase|nr:selenide, water dikinase SelD [Helicobacteraceae bacterium]
MGQFDLTEILPPLGDRAAENDEILRGIGDDAAVFKVAENIAIVQTADFIAPVVDDPFDFGRIAAANALSDIFAMGAEAKTALALVMHDNINVPLDALREILAGGVEKAREARAAIIGGHSVSDREMKYGLAVTGVCDPRRFWRNDTARSGDALILTKPLGMGILTTAAKRDLASKVALREAVDFMARLNLYAARAAAAFEIHAATDITGFGLIGHALEMARSDLTFEVDFAAVPYLRTALSFASQGIAPGGTLGNREFAISRERGVEIARNLTEAESLIIFDAQTSGGLLLAARGDQAAQCLDAIKAAGDERAAIIGRVRDRANSAIVVG